MTLNPFRVGVLAEQLCRRPSGGIGVYLNSLTNALAKQRSVNVVSISSRCPLHVPDSDRQVLLTPHRITNELLTRGLPVPGLQRAIAKQDVLHVPSFDIPKNPPKPMTVFVHDLLWRKWPDAYSKRGVAWHERALLRSIEYADHLMVPSDQVRIDLEQAGASPSRITVTGEGSDHLPLVSPLPYDKRTYFLSVSTAQPRKNMTGLFAAYAAYRQATEHPLPLVVVGPPGWGPDLPAAVPGVELRGAVTDQQLAELYAGAMALVFVPFEEGYGLPVVEAWRAGTAVIASNGVPVAANHPTAVYSVDSTDVDALSTVLLELTNDPFHASQQVIEGTAVAAQLTWIDVASAHMDVWQKVARI